jgi:hypothetical protein
VEVHIVIALAAGLAQGRAGADLAGALWGVQSDEEAARELASYSSGSEDEAEAYVEWLRYRSRAIVWNEMWRAGVLSLATKRLQTLTLTGRRANAAIQAGLTTWRSAKGILHPEALGDS